jgi:hypothetical protein
METKDELREERDKIVLGLEEAYKKLVAFKKEKKSPFIVMKDGEIVAVDAKDMPTSVKYKRG